MKAKILTLVFLFFLGTNLLAQLRIDQNGNIGLGTNWPNPDYKCHIKGNLLLSTFPEIPPPNNTYVEFKFKVGNGWPGAEFGTNIGHVALWSSDYGFNKLYVEKIYELSDSSYKTNIEPLQIGLSEILQLKSYSFHFKHDSIIDPKLSYGFLAQEVQSTLPDIIDTAKNAMLMDYQQIIPILVVAIQEQQETIDSLKNLVNLLQSKKNVYYESEQSVKMDSILLVLDMLKGDLVSCCSQSQNYKVESFPNNISHSSMLLQNKPNPYSDKTSIEFEINENFSYASVIIFDLQGTLIKSLPILQKGKGQIVINGFELAAGMYLYTLVVDDKEVDTKRMILIK